jgi:hypothetical protein
MAAKSRVAVSMKPTGQRPSSAERREAQIAAIANQQVRLKREAAERAVKRAQRPNAQAAFASPKLGSARGRKAL